MKTIFTMVEIATLIGVAPRTVAKWYDSGRLRGYRIPGTQDRRTTREYLIRFLEEHGLTKALLKLEDEDKPEESKVEKTYAVLHANDPYVAYYEGFDRDMKNLCHIALVQNEDVIEIYALDYRKLTTGLQEYLLAAHEGRATLIGVWSPEGDSNATR